MKTGILNTIIHLNLLFIVLLTSCNEPKKITVEMQFPDKKPAIFEIQKGLDPSLKNEKILFENLNLSPHGGSSANRVYANGDFYKIIRGRKTKLDSEYFKWNKIRVLSKNELEKIEKISNHSLVDFINAGPHELVGGLTRIIHWYFYFDQPKFIKTQKRPLYSARSFKDLMSRRNPKFVRKMNRILE